MKKMLGIIIVLLLIIIVIISLAFYSYVKNNSNNNNNSTNKQNISTINSIEEPYMLDGPGSIHNFFRDKSFSEWEELVSRFYGEYYGMYDIEVECNFNDEGKFVSTVTSENEVVAEYVFDDSSGIATETSTGEVVNFDSGVIIPSYGADASMSEYVDFTDNECIAIGYVTDLNEEAFIEKYFPDGSYGILENYDFRYEANRTPGYGNKFVIIPINNKVKITVYDCYIGDDGELYTDNTLILNQNEPFILLDDYIEYTPSMCVKFEYNGFEEMFPITFSGEDGTLDLNGYEMEVKDISLY